MREIKFRGKRLFCEGWEYGDLTREVVGVGVCSYFIDGVRCHQDTIGQYTGANDSKGNEVYEGDVVVSTLNPLKLSGDPQNICGVVTWWKERASFIVDCTLLKDFDKKALQGLPGYKFADGKFVIDFVSHGEVIGNVYDMENMPMFLKPIIS